MSSWLWGLQGNVFEPQVKMLSLWVLQLFRVKGLREGGESSVDPKAGHGWELCTCVLMTRVLVPGFPGLPCGPE